jgi:hypothetical protein
MERSNIGNIGSNYSLKKEALITTEMPGLLLLLFSLSPSAREFA